MKIKVEVTNTGAMAGEEVVQFYLRDEVSTVTRPVKELKGFQRVRLNPGETKLVVFDIEPEMLQFLDLYMQSVTEPGRFIAMVGGSSDDRNLLKIPFNVK